MSQTTGKVVITLVGMAFPARYPGTCDVCRARISTGDMIVGKERWYAHQGCLTGGESDKIVLAKARARPRAMPRARTRVVAVYR